MREVTALDFKKKYIHITFNQSYKIKLSEDSYVQFPLVLGDKLNEQEYEKLEDLVLFDQCFQKAMRLVSYSPQSRKLLKRKLSGKNFFSSPVIEKVLEKLSSLGYVNDEQFCKLFVEQKKNHPDWGELKIRHKLQEYGIAPELVNKYFAPEQVCQEQEYIKASKTLAKRWKSFSSKETLAKKRQKAINFLKRKGFKMPIIFNVLEEEFKGENSSFISGD